MSTEIAEAIATAIDPAPGRGVIRRLRDLALLVCESSDRSAALLRSARAMGSTELASVMAYLVQHRTEILEIPDLVPVESIWTASQAGTWVDLADALVMPGYRAEELCSASLPEV